MKKKDKVISEYMSELGKKSHKVSPRPTEYYSAIGKKGQASKKEAKDTPKI